MCGSFDPMQSYNVPSPLVNWQITIQGTSTFAAMMTNAHILRMNCEPPHTTDIHIAPSTAAPPALAPTALQSIQPHKPWIDLIPFPSLRDNVLRGSEILDSREIWWDVVGGAVRVWGKTPWDKRGWEVQESFAIKWWWLMTDEVLEETNFWRVSRGEGPLNLARIKATIQGGQPFG